MSRRDFKLFFFTLTALAVVSLAVPLSAQPRIYVVNNLGTLGGSGQSNANKINNAGQVVGSANLAGDLASHAFRTAPNASINPATDDLGTLGGTFSDANGINSSGQVVGSAALTGDQIEHAFRTAPNASIHPATDDLGTLGGTNSGATGINDSGQVVGDGTLAGNLILRAFRTGPNAPINPSTDNLGSFGGTYTQVSGINSLGEVVGGASLAGDQIFRAFRTGPNAPINAITDDIGSFGGTYNVAYGINESAQAVGQCSTTGDVAEYAFRTAANAAINPATDNLGTLGGTSGAVSINSSGDAVGTSFTSGTDFQTAHGFIYTGGLIYDLNRLIVPGSGWLVDSGNGINDSGQIAAHGVHAGQGFGRGLRLDPLPAMGILVNPGTPRPASFNIDSEGALPVAILGSASLNVTAIDPASVMFGPNGAKNIRTPVIQDVNKDGKLDLVLYFAPDDSGVNCTDKIAALVASTYGKQLFAGVEVINTTHTFPCPR